MNCETDLRYQFAMAILKINYSCFMVLPRNVYMSSKILQLTVGSRALSQAEKKLLLLQAEQTHKKHFDSVKMVLGGKSCHFKLVHVLLYDIFVRYFGMISQ